MKSGNFTQQITESVARKRTQHSKFWHARYSIVWILHAKVLFLFLLWKKNFTKDTDISKKSRQSNESLFSYGAIRERHQKSIIEKYLNQVTLCCKLPPRGKLSTFLRPTKNPLVCLGSYPWGKPMTCA